jgi:GNAT superfamily N-acetyltransferase
VLIRDLALADIPQLNDIRQALFPWWVSTVATQENWFHTVTEESRSMRIVAEVNGRVVAMSMGGLNTSTTEEGAIWSYVSVHPDFQGQGVGGALWERMEGHLRSIGGRRVNGFGLADDATHAWLTKRGFERGASLRYSVADLAQLPPEPEAAEGVTVIPAQQAGPDTVYHLDVTSGLDEPNDIPYDSVPKEEWLDRVWHSPDLDHDASTVALVHGVPAAYTNLEVNPDSKRAWAAGTGTLREFRGLGLAKLIKSRSLRLARGRGITHAYTSNDYSNAPMLAINDWLGYEVVGTQWSYLRDLSKD